MRESCSPVPLLCRLGCWGAAAEPCLWVSRVSSLKPVGICWQLENFQFGNCLSCLTRGSRLRAGALFDPLEIPRKLRETLGARLLCAGLPGIAVFQPDVLTALRACQSALQQQQQAHGSSRRARRAITLSFQLRVQSAEVRRESKCLFVISFNNPNSLALGVVVARRQKGLAARTTR